MKRRVACVTSRLDNLEAIECARRVIAVLREAGWNVLVEYNLAVLTGMGGDGTFFADAPHPECTTHIVVGGDGTLLRLAGSVETGVIVGIRRGRRGFLTGFECGNEDIERIALMDYNVCEVARLVAKREREGYVFPPALNEVAVIASRGKTLGVRVETLSGEVLMRVRGDGVIVATVPGSYAYSSSAGGPHLLAEDVIVVTPLNPMNRIAPLVVSANALRIVAEEGYRAAWVFIDGHYSSTLTIGAGLVVEKGMPIRIAYPSRCPWSETIKNPCKAETLNG